MLQILRTKFVSLIGANSGEMLNLVTNDTQKLVDAATFFHHGMMILPGRSISLVCFSVDVLICSI